MLCFEFDIESYDGLKLHGQSWTPDGEVRAVVCFVHGLGEHSGRYGHVAEAFSDAGYALMACDLRGHGRSEGKRGHAPSYTALMDDLFELLETAGKRYPDVPVFLYGHSLGGNLVIHFALRRLPKPAGIIASSPLLKPTVQPPAWKIELLRAMYRLWPGLTVSSGLETLALSRDEAVLEAHRNDPLRHDRVSARLGLDMLRYGLWNMSHAANIPCPMLLMHGKADRITSAKASREFAYRAGAACTLRLWNGCYHELHNEPDQQHVIEYVLSWMDEIVSHTG